MKKRKLNSRYIVCVVVTIGFLACFLLFPNSIGRLAESGRDLGLSVAYYFCELFGVEHDITPKVVNLPQIPFFRPPSSSSDPAVPALPLPTTWDGFKAKWSAYWHLWASTTNLRAYLSFLSGGLFTVCKIIVIALPFVCAAFLYFHRYLRAQNNDYNRDSKPLRAFKWLTAHTLRPAATQCQSLFVYIKERRRFWVSWLLLWLLYFNVYTIVLEFLAFYLYFIVSFDVSGIYRQVYKLFIDLSPVLSFVPLWAWAILAVFLFDRFRKNIAYARLHHMEMRNRGFINARPVVSMLNGTMGKGKTTANADMGLSASVMFRDKAFEKLLENDLKFPCFPWINLENELRRAMATHTVYNLATCRRFVRFLHRRNVQCESLSMASVKAVRRHLRRRYGVSVATSSLRLFDYDADRYGTLYNDGLQVADLWQVLETYAQLYFIYVIESSLLIANFSVRTDEILSDLGNFPLWNADFFRRDARLMDAYSRHAHILDFDSLRLGRKVVANNPDTDGFEFGVVLITEVGKERGNNLENQEKKKSSADTNQKNDGFNRWLKMARHSATVDNFPFVKVITDEQRPESWGADARDLCEIIHVRERSEPRLAMPFFSVAELLHAWLFGKFSGLYREYRFVRADNTLPLYLFKAIAAKLHGYYVNTYNRFGYHVLRVQIESGTQDGQLDENKYFLMSKKIYSKRFSTDCFSDFFATKVLRSPVGLDDLPEYATEKASFAELRKQNSYFISDLSDSMRGVHNEKEK